MSERSTWSWSELMHPALSVIVPTFNRRERLLRLLQSLEDEYNAGARFEVVVTVDGSIDGTIEVLEDASPPFVLQIIVQNNQGPAAARNRAIAAAKSDLLLLLDDDVTVVPGLIERHMVAHADDPVTVAIGTMLPQPGVVLSPWLRWEAATLQKQYDAMLSGLYDATLRQFYTGNVSLRRDLALRAGGFDQSFRRGEDLEFAWRLDEAGARFCFLPEARVWHEPDRSLDDWLIVPYQYGRYDAVLARDHARPEPLAGAFEEWGSRRRLNRFVARLCVGHELRRQAVVGALGAYLKLTGPAARARAQHFACSALFSIEYWQGVADAMNLGSRVWRAGALLAAGGVPENAAMPREPERISR